MNSMTRFAGTLGILMILAFAQAQPQPKLPGQLSVSAEISYPYLDPCSTRTESIDLTIREARTNRLVGLYNTCNFPTQQVYKDSLGGCYGRPGPCPSAVVFMNLLDGEYNVSAELHDSTFQQSMGERGASKVLGYFVADRASADTVNFTKPQQATVLTISGGQRSHRVILRIW